MDVPSYDDLYQLEEKIERLSEKIDYIINTLIKPREEWAIVHIYNFWDGTSFRAIARFSTQQDAKRYLDNSKLKNGKFSKKSLLFNMNPDYIDIKPVLPEFYPKIPLNPELSRGSKR